MHKLLTRYTGLVTLLLVWGLAAFGQTPATGIPATGAPAARSRAATDTAVKPRILKSVFGNVATDSVPVGPNSSKQKVDLPVSPGDSIRVGQSTFSTGSDSLVKSADTTQLSARQNAAIHKIIPRKATIRALIFPGLGQAYNRQYLKMPFVYAGFAIIFYDIIHFTSTYNQYLNGYRSAYNLPDTLAAGTTTYPNGLSYKNAVVNGRAYTISQLKQGADFWRRNRDLNIILGVLLWGLQAVEANVAAHLKTFDISEDISATWKPTLMLAPGGSGLMPGVRLTFNFKH